MQNEMQVSQVRELSLEEVESVNGGGFATAACIGGFAALGALGGAIGAGATTGGIGLGAGAYWGFNVGTAFGAYVC